MNIKLNHRYRLAKEYLDSLSVKPTNDLISVTAAYNGAVSYTDGIGLFFDKLVNIAPHLQEPDFMFNTSAVKKSEPVVVPVVNPTTPVTEPTIPVIEPVTPAPIIIPDPVVPTPVVPEPTPDPAPAPDPVNPYGDNYL